MLTHKEKWLLGGKKYNKNLNKKLKEQYFKNPKKCLYCNNILDYKIRRNTFCNSKCSCSFNNEKRKTNGFYKKGLTKEAKCSICKEIFNISKNSSFKNVKCNKCYIKPLFVKECSVCEKEFKTDKKTIKTCSKICCNIAKLNGAKLAGKISAQVQSKTRRSKNEIYFSELCKNKFKNILTNESIFNGWDADIILPDLKIAILWNGIWHYKKITKKHSVKQVKNRDEIKIKEIQNFGYMPYIVKDMGKYDKIFVEEKFKEFLAVVGIAPTI